MFGVLLLSWMITATYAQCYQAPNCALLENNNLHPHESTCYLYYKCENRMRLLLKCPTNQVFDADSKTCKYCADVETCCKTNRDLAKDCNFNSEITKEQKTEKKDGSQIYKINEVDTTTTERYTTGTSASNATTTTERYTGTPTTTISSDTTTERFTGSTIEDTSTPHSDITTERYTGSSTINGSSTTTTPSGSTTTNTPCIQQHCNGTSTYGYYFPDITNCSNYIYCDMNGVEIMSTCEEGLHFNPDLFICMDPSNANCVLCNGGSTITDNSTPTTPIGTSSTTQAPCIQQHCTVELYGYYLPNVTDCTKYIYCEENGVEESRDCPPGLHYSPTLYSCFSPEVANCPDCTRDNTSSVKKIKPFQRSSTKVNNNFIRQRINKYLRTK